ncbi:MAG: general secretion pathway protein GspE [Sulfuricurvum sp. PC08-66]|nr:MAG: general secretion pathway protein GspE [Sulfuricurvum sp. PC08-66]
MDQITQDLLQQGHINERQIERIKQRGVKEENILETLVKVSVISANFLIRFILTQLKNGAYSIDILNDYPFVDKPKLLTALAQSLQLSYVDLDALAVDYRIAERVSLGQLQKAQAMPVAEDDLHVTIAVADPLNIATQDTLQRLFPRKPLQFVVSTQNQIIAFLNKIEIKSSVKDLVADIRKELTHANGKEESELSAIVKLIDVVLRQAILLRASDIHIEPTQTSCVVRARIDGHLQEIFIFDNDIYPPLVSRIKLLANLDIAERRKPQDGRFSTMIGEREFDFRLSTLPILTGESIVMRILDKSKVMIKLENSGMNSFNYKRLVQALHTPYGIVLVTGPTGSGKTTTLYGALNELRNVAEKIITVEDPVEYRMNLVQQVQVNPKVGLDFATALRSILRQDPDKIMIGEIRDKETLRIAIQAALTGHLVLSTLHTNDAVSAIQRMLDMGIESYLISGAVVAIQAQRLVRKICPVCKEKVSPLQSILEDIDTLLPDNPTFFKGKGCRECGFSGYMGREMLSEVLPVSEPIASLIASGASKEAILTQAVQEGFQSMLQNGIEKVMDGTTTIDEVLRVAKL